MKWMAAILLVIFISLQYRLWFGQSSFQKIELQHNKIKEVKIKNAEFTQRNQKLLAEIKGLRKGTDSVEERARYQLGMIKEGEVFFRILTTQNKEQ
ncbi:cell division protein FtsB [Kangiella sp. HZ709]|uniref:cell division protein FtsB n=1 Tax=Kangiella sp. HZ709 TaxID=2666328 RepID=UPI0012AFAD76|nr:cell division protein FtsB [Kangiella sp. HZ709]MRX28388.1 cell division protein FtsB [Kangiella sp. HZ709]